MMKKPFLGNRYSRLGPYHKYLKEPVRAEARRRIMDEVLPAAHLNHVPCLCGNSNKGVLIASIDRWGLPCSSVLCEHCGMIRVNPRWDDKTYGEIYSELYWPMAMGSSQIDQSRFELSVRRAMPYAHFLKANYDLADKDVIELGCSYGAGLQVVKHADASLIGYDYDRRMLDYGRRFTNLDLRYGGAKEAVKEGKQYDLIILRHVFEHMLDPKGEMELLKELLRTDGSLFVEVPGILNPQWWLPDPEGYFNNFHVYSYALHHLDCVMRSNGFQLIQGTEHIYSLWRRGTEKTDVRWQNQALVKRILNHLSVMERTRRLAAFRASIARIPAKIHSYFRKDLTG